MEFYPQTREEHAHQKVEPRLYPYRCGWCERDVNGRLLALEELGNNKTALWLQCFCQNPTVILTYTISGAMASQSPAAKHFQAGDRWPKELEKLFMEAVQAFGAGSYTASTMVARKMLMVCACQKGAEDDMKFADYVDYISNTVLTYPAAKNSIDQIRQIGNGANHEINFVTREAAEKALKILIYLLNAIYSFPELANGGSAR